MNACGPDFDGTFNFHQGDGQAANSVLPGFLSFLFLKTEMMTNTLPTMSTTVVKIRTEASAVVTPTPAEGVRSDAQETDSEQFPSPDISALLCIRDPTSRRTHSVPVWVLDKPSESPPHHTLSVHRPISVTSQS